MNLFYLHHEHKQNAEWHIDAHVRKMPLEAAQIICTTFHLLSLDNSFQIPYKPTHRNHKCVVWARSTYNNLSWVVDYGLSLCQEYTFRFNKIHKCESVIIKLSQNLSILNIPNSVGLTNHALAMPLKYQSTDPTQSYRNFYKYEKRFNKSGKPMDIWSGRSRPEWFDL